MKEKTKAYVEQHPGTKLLRMGIGDVWIYAGMRHPFLREKIAEHYEKRGVSLAADEVFVSSGASDELGYTVIPKALKRNGMNLNEM